MSTDPGLTARRSKRGWLWYCYDCERGPMSAGPMQSHLMGSAHAMTLSAAQRCQYEAQRPVLEAMTTPFVPAQRAERSER